MEQVTKGLHTCMCYPFPGSGQAHTRAWYTPVMCRYAFKSYKSHFACFTCRKAFKKAPLQDYVKHKGLEEAYARIARTAGSPEQRARVERSLGITLQQIEEMYLQDVCTCPECAQPMAAMGLDFKAPRHHDFEAWTIIRHLHEHGFAFQGCGCSVGYKPPSSMRELPAWLEAHVRKSDRERLLQELRLKRC